MRPHPQRHFGPIRHAAHAAAGREAAEAQEGLRQQQGDGPPRHHPHRRGPAEPDGHGEAGVRPGGAPLHRGVLPRLPLCDHHGAGPRGRRAVQGYGQGDTGTGLARCLRSGAPGRRCRCGRRGEDGRGGTHIARLRQRRKRSARAFAHAENDAAAQALHRGYPAPRHGNGGTHGRRRGTARRDEGERHWPPLHPRGHHRDALPPPVHPPPAQGHHAHADGRRTHLHHPQRAAEECRTHGPLGAEVAPD